MGHQQILLIILGIILIAISIVIGYSQFMSSTADHNKDAVTNKLITIAANAYQYKISSSLLGGGGNSYSNYSLSHTFVHDDNGDYALGAVHSGSVTVTGSSSINSGWVATCVVDDTGRSDISYSGW